MKKEKNVTDAPQDPVAPEAEPAEGTAEVSLEEALKAKEAEAAANWDKFLRERADLENLRKRYQKEKEDLLKYGNESIILEILPAVDNLERALEHVEEGCADSITAGVQMTLSMLMSSLKKFGVNAVEAATGGSFDPAFHQAMSQVETADVEAGKIYQVFQKGYLLNDRLLRPAMVSVAAAPKA